MRARFNQSFKLQAVEKALSRSEGINLATIAKSLGVGNSTLSKWIYKARNQTLEDVSNESVYKVSGGVCEKRPQDWTDTEKLNLVIRCGSMTDVEVNQVCREQGVYVHHINQWKAAFSNGTMTNRQDSNIAENRRLKTENKALKKELNRKDKALAEAAALLILQKKVREIWGSDEDNSQ